MIKIDLLPQNLKKKESTSKIPVFPILALVILVVLAINILLGLLILYKKAQVGILNKKWNGMQAQFKEVEDLKNGLKAKEDKIKIMEYVTKRDIYWTDFFNKINQAVPKGLWFNRLALSKQGLIIEGSVFSFSTDKVTLVNKFYNELKNDEFFKLNFVNFSLDSVQKRIIKDYEILDFLLTAKINEKRFEVEYSPKR